MSNSLFKPHKAEVDLNKPASSAGGDIKDQLDKTIESLNVIVDAEYKLRAAMTSMDEIVVKTNDSLQQLMVAFDKAKPIYDGLLKKYSSQIVISDESIDAYTKAMDAFSKKILEKTFNGIDEVVKAKLADFNQHKSLVDDIILKNRIVMGKYSFWIIISICISIILGGGAGWLKFWRIPGNDDTMTYMLIVLFFESIYILTVVWNLVWNYFKGEAPPKKEKQNDPMFFSFSLSSAIYIIALTLSSGVYVVWSQITVVSDTWLLLYLLPLAVASNLIWSVLKAIVTGATKT